MKKICLALLTACALMACTGPKMVQEVTPILEINLKGKTQAWSYTCEYNEYSCNSRTLENARTMYMGDDTNYVCTLTGSLYMYRGTYHGLTNMILIEGASCNFRVKVENKKV